MTILVQQLREEIEQLKAENFSLRDALADKVVDSTKLRAFLPADGGFTIGLEGGPCALLADAFGEQLYTSNAINYLQLTFTSGAYPDLGQIVVTLQRCTGKTPHELRIDAEQEREQLKAENAELRAKLEMTNKHGEVLQQIGNALRLGAGSDLHTTCVPEIVALRRDAERYRWVRQPVNGNEVFAMAGGGECGGNMDAAIDQAMTKEQP